MNHSSLSATSAQHSQTFSRRRMVIGGAIAGMGSAIGLSALKAGAAKAAHLDADTANDVEILNGALYYEHQAIWAYSFAAGALSSTDVGQAVLSLALANQADHITHRDTLIQVVSDLGGMPVEAESQYDLSAYLERGDGGLDSDVNIAKLALALETDAAIAYADEVARLKTPALITAGATIAAAEASHATAIRAAFIALGVDIPNVPAAFVSSDTRDQWVIKV